MKNVFVLTAHDSKTNSFIFTDHFSNFKAAKQSFDILKIHLLKKYSIDSNKVMKYTFIDGGEHQTDILDNRINITLNKWKLKKDTIGSFI
jgi:hypothetical protein